MDDMSYLQDLYLEKLQSALERIQASIGDKGTVTLCHVTIPDSNTEQDDSKNT